MPGISTYLAERQLLQAYVGDDGTNVARINQFLNQAYLWLQLQSNWSWLRYSGVVTLEKRYTTGTVTLTEGDATITLAGGTWDITWVSRQIYVNGEVYAIASFTNANEAELNRVAKFSGSGLAYTMFRSVYTLASRMRCVNVLQPTQTPWEPLGIVTPELMAFTRSQNPIFKDPPNMAALRDVDSDVIPTLEVWPWPSDDARGVFYEGFRLLPLLSADGDTLLIPSTLLDIFRNKALSRLWHWRNDSRWQEAEAKAVGDLRAAVDIDPADDDRGDRVMLDKDVFLGPNATNWPPRAGMG